MNSMHPNIAAWKNKNKTQYVMQNKWCMPLVVARMQENIWTQ